MEGDRMPNPSATQTDFLKAIRSIKTNEPGAMQQIALIINQFDIKPDENSERSQKIQNLIIEANRHHIRRHNILFGENGEKRARAEYVRQARIATQPSSTDNQPVITNPTTQSTALENSEFETKEMPSIEHAERLERVTEMIQDLTTLNELLTDLQMRATSIVASTPTDGPREATKLWDEAVGKIKISLNRLIQISDDTNPISLLDAKHKLENMVALFKENAAGAEGIGLQEDENRLKNFEDRLESIDPSITKLIKSINETLSEETLQTKYLDEKSKQLEQFYEEDRKRISKINNRIQELKGGLTNRIIKIQRELESFRTNLTKTIKENNLESDLITLGNKWLASISQSSEKFPTEQNITTLVEWAEKFKSDKSFTELKLRNKIKKDLIRQIIASEKTFGIQKSRYNPQKLLDESKQRRLRAVGNIKNSVEKISSETRKLYQDLITMRRSKMGENFDERFSGSVAQDISILIEDLADFEVRLIRFTSDLSSVEKVEQTLIAKTNELKAELKNFILRAQIFTDSAKLEELLSKQLIAILSPMKEKIMLIFNSISNLKLLKTEIQILPGTKIYTTKMDKVILAGENLATSISSFINIAIKNEIKTGIKEDIEQISRTIDNFIQKADSITNKEVFLEMLLKKFSNDLNDRESKLVDMYDMQTNFANRIYEKVSILKEQLNQKLENEKQQTEKILLNIKEEFSKIDTDLSAIYENNLEKSLRLSLGKLNTWIEKEIAEIEKLENNKVTLSVNEIRNWLEELETRKTTKDFVQGKLFMLKDLLSKDKPSKVQQLFLTNFEEINKKVTNLNLPEKIDLTMPFDQNKIASFRETLNSIAS